MELFMLILTVLAVVVGGSIALSITCAIVFGIVDFVVGIANSISDWFEGM